MNMKFEMNCTHLRIILLIAGVNPDIEYPRLYRIMAELWMYMGLAWLSLFFSWNVHMVVAAHKVLRKKRQHRHRNRPLYMEPDPVQQQKQQDVRPTVVDIFNFLSEKDEDYSTVIKEIGINARKRKPPPIQNINRSKSCSDILADYIQTLEHSPRHKRHISLSEVFANATVDESQQEEEENIKEPTSEACGITDHEQNKKDGSPESVNDGITFTSPDSDAAEEEKVQHPDGGETRFTIAKVAEKNNCIDEKG